MSRIIPENELLDKPCSIVAVTCALKGCVPKNEDTYVARIRDDGYATLNSANWFIRENLPIKKRIDFKRGQRPLLKDISHDIKAVICVYGHYLYYEYGNYWSYFDNDNDEVVAIWQIAE